MRKMKRILTLAMTAAMLLSSITVNAATPSLTAKQNADYMISINEEGTPNWFNGAFYSDKYEDLKVAFNKNEKALYNHSLSFGLNESRLVTPVLDVVKYRTFYPDLDKAFGDNWKLYVRHYFEYGINEGRENFTDFDAKTYLSMYADLQNAFGTDLGLATRHYIEHGISEGREYNLPETKTVYKATDNDNAGDDDSSNSGSSDDDTIDEHFTGEKREDYEDGSYAIAEYRDGKMYTRIFYNADNVMTNQELYNEEGHLYSDSFYDENTGSLTYEYTYTYDTNGNCIKMVNYDVEADYTVTCVYEYDSNGNQIKSTQYNRNELGEDILTYITTSEYNDLGQKIKDVERNNSNTVVRTWFYTYYSNGVKSEISYYGETTNKERERQYYESGMIKSELYYDTAGNITDSWYYDEDGNEINN